jgi:hypothetical protein
MMNILENYDGKKEQIIVKSGRNSYTSRNKTKQDKISKTKSMVFDIKE